MASSTIGNTGSSSLLRSAASIATARADYQDKLAALQWSNSAKTDTDWMQYAKYLNDRIDRLQGTGRLSDASKALTMTSTLESAQKSFVSSTIQRRSIDLLEGNATLQDKANAVASFYQMAVNNGDDGLAQNLRQQYDSIDQQIQYQAQQQQQLAESMAAKNVTSIGALVATYKQDLSQFSSQFREFGAKGLDALSKQYAKNLKASGIDIPNGKNPSVWDIANGVVTKMLDTLQQAINVYGPVQGASLVNEYNNIVNGTTRFDVGGLKLDYTQLNDAVMANAAGQEYARPVDRGGKTVLVANKEQSYMWGKDPTTGQFKLVTAYSPQGADLGSSGVYRQDARGNYLDAGGNVIAKSVNGQVVDKNGKAFVDEAAMNTTLDRSQFSYADMLKNAGFNVRSGANGELYITGTDKTASFFQQNSLDPSEEVQVLRGANGQLRFITPPDENGNMNLYGLSFGRNGQFSSLFKVNPLSDTQSGFAASLSSVNGLINAAQIKQTQALKIAQLQQQVKAAAQLPALPKVQAPPPVQPAINPQPVAPAQVVQPAAPAKVVQNANATPQSAAKTNINQSGGGGIKLQPSHGSSIPL